MDVLSKSIPKRRVPKGEWPKIQVSFNAEHGKNKSVSALRSMYCRGERCVTTAVFDHLDRIDAEIQELIRRGEERNGGRA